MTIRGSFIIYNISVQWDYIDNNQGNKGCYNITYLGSTSSKQILSLSCIFSMVLWGAGTNFIKFRYSWVERLQNLNFTKRAFFLTPFNQYTLRIIMIKMPKMVRYNSFIIYNISVQWVHIDNNEGQAILVRYISFIS